MALSPIELKKHLKAKGWASVDIAARWEISCSWISTVINNPHRSRRDEDALLGLPARATVEVQREKRHIRKKKTSTVWAIEATYPKTRIFVALSNLYCEEGTRVRIHDYLLTSPTPKIQFGVENEESMVTLTTSEFAAHFADTGLDY